MLFWFIHFLISYHLVSAYDSSFTFTPILYDFEETFISFSENTLDTTDDFTITPDICIICFVHSCFFIIFIPFFVYLRFHFLLAVFYQSRNVVCIVLPNEI
jgi:hypothetical protein